MAVHRRCYVPVFVELYGEAAHLLHGAVGEGELHEWLVRLPAEGAGDLQSLTLLRRQPNLEQHNHQHAASALVNFGAFSHLNLASFLLWLSVNQ